MTALLRATLVLALALTLTALLAAACARPAEGPVTPPPEPAGGASPDAAADAGTAAPGAASPAPAPPAPVPPAAGEPPSPAPADLPAGPLRLRVGLASDRPRVSLPCCGEHLVVTAGGQRLTLTSPTVVEPAGDLADRAVYRLQVAALRDAGQAAALAGELSGRWGWPADAHFDAGDGLYKVRLGRFGDRPAAEAAQRRLLAAGSEDVWIAQEGGALSDPALRVVRGGRAAQVPGRWLRVRSLRREPVLSWEDGLYRGDLLVFLNDRGSLNVINELDLEDYLRGVVPAEMGPAQYDRLEALKAQAVAARTYTLRHLAGFVDEGYDLCATPRCQVYGGRAAEHPLSDRAVAATAGQVMLYGGEPVDARYSATCGGHTENVEVMFPDERAPYLRGVPCVEAGVVPVAEDGVADPGRTLEAAVSRRLAPPPSPPRTGRPVPPAAELAVRLEALAVRAGLPVPRRGGLRSTARRDVERFVSGLFDLALGPRVLLAADELPRLASAPPAEWSPTERRQAALLLAAGLYGGAPDARVEGEAAERLVFHLALLAGVLESEEVSFRAAEPTAGGVELRVLPHGGERERRLPLAGVALFRRLGGGGDRTAGAESLDLVPGDPLTVFYAEGGPLALVLDVAAAAPPADPPHRRTSWVRFRGDAELARLVEDRYPGFPFSRFEIVSRGVSGRVGAIRLHGRDGRQVVVEGLAVRWTLDVPDTRFQVERVRGGYRFAGRGWGHGVGLCQMGSYTLAGRGLGYRDILFHYYSGVELVRARPRAPRWDEPAPALAPAPAETAAR